MSDGGQLSIAVARREERDFQNPRHRMLIADIDDVRVGTAASNLRSEGDGSKFLPNRVHSLEFQEMSGENDVALTLGHGRQGRDRHRR